MEGQCGYLVCILLDMFFKSPANYFIYLSILSHSHLAIDFQYLLPVPCPGAWLAQLMSSPCWTYWGHWFNSWLEPFWITTHKGSPTGLATEHEWDGFQHTGWEQLSTFWDKELLTGMSVEDPGSKGGSPTPILPVQGIRLNDSHLCVSLCVVTMVGFADATCT